MNINIRYSVALRSARVEQKSQMLLVVLKFRVCVLPHGFMKAPSSKNFTEVPAFWQKFFSIFLGISR